MSSKKKVLYLGHQYHNKTKSTKFLTDMLEENYSVTYAAYDPYSARLECEEESIGGTCYDILICFQIMLPVIYLDSIIQYRHGVLFPMYDGCINLPEARWYEYRHFTIISFSKTVFDKLSADGYHVKYIQYFPEPARKFTAGAEDSVFFWYRSKVINFQVVKRLLSGLPVKKLHIHNAPDPEMPELQTEEAPFEMEESTWFPDAGDMKGIMEKAALYIAPRAAEGIGMSFLEAMAMGRCVIAPDCPTMNEYITDGVTGILYDIANPQPVRIQDIQKIQQDTYEYMCAGYRRWQQNKAYILRWLEEDAPAAPLFHTCEGTAEAYGHYDVRPISDREAEKNTTLRYYSHYLIQDRWMENYAQGKRADDYLKFRNILSVAIYGIGQFGKRLYDELEHSTIMVSYFLDAASGCSYKGLDAIQFTKDLRSLPQVDAIIITPVQYYKSIKSSLESVTDIRLMSLAEIVFCL